MKTIIATAALFLLAGACFAGVQPTQQRGRLSMTDVLTYNNITCQKSSKTNSPKVYATQPEAAESKSSSLPSTTYNNTNPGQTFTPTPLVNFYKEFR